MFIWFFIKNCILLITDCKFESTATFGDEYCQQLVQGVHKFFNPDYGFCYTFNYAGPEIIPRQNWTYQKPRRTSFHGPLCTHFFIYPVLCSHNCSHKSPIFYVLYFLTVPAFFLMYFALSQIL